MRDESQNALLKTLEEPPGFAHLILITSEPSALLETIASRCQPIDFAPLPPEAIEAQLSIDGSPDELPPPPASPPATSPVPATCSRTPAERFGQVRLNWEGPPLRPGPPSSRPRSQKAKRPKQPRGSSSRKKRKPA